MEQSELSRVKAELARVQAQLAEQHARHVAAGSTGGRPKKVPDTVCAELARLVAVGNAPDDARRLLCTRYGVTPQGLGQAIRRVQRRAEKTT